MTEEIREEQNVKSDELTDGAAQKIYSIQYLQPPSTTN